MVLFGGHGLVASELTGNWIHRIMCYLMLTVPVVFAFLVGRIL